MTAEDRLTPSLTPPGTLSRRAEYTGEPGCIAEARALSDRFLTELAAEWLAAVPERTAADVRLVVSELVTNADRHTGGPYVLELEGCARWLTVTVYDADCARPVFHRSDPGRVGGHGMEIVRALCTRLSVKTIPAGKRVRAEFALAPAAETPETSASEAPAPGTSRPGASASGASAAADRTVPEPRTGPPRPYDPFSTYDRSSPPRRPPGPAEPFGPSGPRGTE